MFKFQMFILSPDRLPAQCRPNTIVYNCLKSKRARSFCLGSLRLMGSNFLQRCYALAHARAGREVAATARAVAVVFAAPLWDAVTPLGRYRAAAATAALGAAPGAREERPSGCAWATQWIGRAVAVPLDARHRQFWALFLLCPPSLSSSLLISFNTFFRRNLFAICTLLRTHTS
jgi:hypothetical protein